jgi:hypothetical protein
MTNFSIFCKSYEGDLLRFERLWQSIKNFNIQKIDCFICVPKRDLSLFKNKINDPVEYLHWICDEDIVQLSPYAEAMDLYAAWDGRLSQQVIKAEFWRYLEKIGFGDSSYLCIDSESVFIKDFKVSDFMYSAEFPYTVMHQSKDLLQLAANKKIKKVVENFHKDCYLIKEVFNRVGYDYDFGPTPVIWSSKVWQDLDKNYLQPLKTTIWHAIQDRPSELRWYGEALLHFKSIPLYPIEPIFRVYHYDWQYFSLRAQGETIETISQEFLGYLKQSSWEFEADYGSHAKRKSIASRCLRVVKRFFSKYR